MKWIILILGFMLIELSNNNIIDKLESIDDNINGLTCEIEGLRK